MNAPDLTFQQGAQVIREGGVVAFPTETVYGLGADATKAKAVARVFEIKARPSFNPLICHVATIEAAQEVGEFNQQALDLAGAFWPGPLAIVVPSKGVVADLVSAGLDTIALRIPRHSVALEFLAACGVPVAAPSANPSGYVSPTCKEHVIAQLGEVVDGVIDGGPCEVGLESTVVSVADGKVKILRTGAVTQQDLERVVSVPVITGEAVHEKPQSPGQLSKHYSPSTAFELVDSLGELNTEDIAGNNVAFLCLQSPPSKLASVASHVEVLSESGDLIEAASRLFAAMRMLDSGNYTKIIAESVPAEGVGIAINDRLKRAASQ